MLFLSFLSAVLLWPAVAFADFGYRDYGANYVIDSGADRVIAVIKCCGDIVSMRYKVVECKSSGPGRRASTTRATRTGARWTTTTSARATDVRACT